jgi:hypothetical protein
MPMRINFLATNNEDNDERCVRARVFVIDKFAAKEMKNAAQSWGKQKCPPLRSQPQDETRFEFWSQVLILFFGSRSSKILLTRLTLSKKR